LRFSLNIKYQFESRANSFRDCLPFDIGISSTSEINIPCQIVLGSILRVDISENHTSCIVKFILNIGNCIASMLITW
jgi:hypothetical protein